MSVHKNKKGLSTVLATVLIITITVIAAALIADFIVPFVSQGLERGSECLNYERYFTFDERFGYNCYTNPNLVISVKAQNDPSLGSKIEGFNVNVLFDTGTTKTVEVRPGASGIVTRGSSSVVIPSPGDTYTYNISIGTSAPSRAELYPVLDTGRICQKQSGAIRIRTPCTAA